MIVPDQERSGLDRFGVPSGEMRAEVELDPSLRFDAPLKDASAPPANIFLTGATGFLGAFLVDEILKQTQANVYCLVRCSSEKEGRQRIYKTLETFLPADSWDAARIIPVLRRSVQAAFRSVPRRVRRAGRNRRFDIAQCGRGSWPVYI